MFLKCGVTLLIFVTCSYTFNTSNELKSGKVSNITSSETESPDKPEPELPSDDNQLTETTNSPPSDHDPIVSDTEQIYPSDAEEYVTDDLINGNKFEPFSSDPETAEPSSHSWLNGTVPYFIDDEIYDDIIIHRIQKAMNVIQSASCLVFKRILESPDNSEIGTNRQHWLHFTNPEKKRECIHGVRFGNVGEPVIVLGFDCMQVRDIIHALLHALGFNDEVTHPQRDSYVRILWHNIQPQYQYLFKIQDPPLPSETLTEYDTMSVMHFHDRAYSMNGAATIVPSVPGLIINPSESLSLLDKMKLRLAFGQECNRRKVFNLVMSCKKALADSKEKPSRPTKLSVSNKSSENKRKRVLYDEYVETESSEFDVDSVNDVDNIDIGDGGPNTADENKNTDEENKKNILKMLCGSS